MKNWILWSFSRGSFQYDVLCALILFAIFVIPRSAFNDRPEYMRLPETGEVRTSVDVDENEVYTVKVDSSELNGRSGREVAEMKLEAFLGESLETYRVEDVPDSRGGVVAYALWIK